MLRIHISVKCNFLYFMKTESKIETETKIIRPLKLCFIYSVQVYTFGIIFDESPRTSTQNKDDCSM